MPKQNIAGKQTHKFFDKTAHIRTGLVVFVLFSLVQSTIVATNAGPVRIKSGDWMRYDSINVGAVPFNSQTAWTKIEFLNVSGSTMTMQVTSRFTNGTEKVGAGCCMPSSGGPVKINVEANTKSSGGFSGFVIPTDLNIGDVFRISGLGNVTITGKTTRTYAGVSRTVVYTLLSLR